MEAQADGNFEPKSKLVKFTRHYHNLWKEEIIPGYKEEWNWAVRRLAGGIFKMSEELNPRK